MTAAPKRILIVAEHASVRFGGEASLPYHYFRILRQRGLDAHLIVHERTRDELVALFPDDLDRLHFVRDMASQRLFFKLSLLIPRRISEATFGLTNQLLTQFAQRAIVRSLVTPNTVVHQPIPVSPRFPSLLSDVGAPVVIGPLNGGMDFPDAFSHSESFFVRTAIWFGRSVSDVVHIFARGKREAAVILVANPRTKEALPSHVQGQVIELVENGVDLSRWQATEAVASPLQPTNFLFIGRLVDWKALDIVIEAVARTEGATLDVIGDGPMRPAWEALAQSLHLGTRVRFLGWLSQADCAQHLASSIGLLLPSVYECGGAVVLEAMAMSKPVIATNWGGPADYVDASCGILVAPTSRASMIEEFAQGMQRLLSDPALCQAMGDAGRARVLAHFDWEKKADTILEIYEKALGRV